MVTVPLLRAAVFAVLTSAAASPAGPSSKPLPVDAVRIDPSTGFLRDSKGRVRIFHGFNVVYKEAPWYPPSDAFTPTDSLDGHTMDLMHSWGFNIVRLGVMWPGVEPSRGKVDEAYLQEVSRLSAELAKRGIYTLADLHQDLGSRHFCGEGFPEYYVDALAEDPNSTLSKASKFPKPLPITLPVDSQTRIPALKDCLKRDFGVYYTTDRVGALFSELYTPGSTLNLGFVRFWGTVAKAFRGQPHVLGYELLNEPSGFCLGGGAFSCKDVPGLAFSNSVEGRKLTPLYQAAARAIRAVDLDTPIFFEGTVPPKMVDIFPDLPLGNETQQGFAYHIYCQPHEGNGPVAAAECRAAQEMFTRSYFRFLNKHKRIPGIMTEFGAIGGSPEELEHMEFLLGKMDEQFQGWTYWMLKKYHDFTTANSAESLYDENGNVEEEKLKALSRTYAPAIAGEPNHMNFDPKTGDFELSFRATIEEAATEVYLNEALNYPNGYTTEVTPSGCLSQSSNEQNYIQFELILGAACKGSNVTVRIVRHQKDATQAFII